MPKINSPITPSSSPLPQSPVSEKPAVEGQSVSQSKDGLDVKTKSTPESSLKSERALLSQAEKEVGIPRYFIKNMQLFRGGFKDKAGADWKGNGEPFAPVYDLNSTDAVKALRSLAGTAESENVSSDLQALGDQLENHLNEAPGTIKPLLVKGSLLKHLYSIDRANHTLLNPCKEPVAFADGGIRAFSTFDWSGDAASIPPVLTVPSEELIALQALAKQSTRWQNWKSEKSTGKSNFDHDLILGKGTENGADQGMWVFQVVANTDGGRHPWIRMVDPQGTMREVGFGYMDKVPAANEKLGNLAKGRFAALDPNERKASTKRVTSMPISSREARHVMDSVMAYQRRLADAEKANESGPAYHLLQQNCAAFVSGIMAEVFDIHLTEEARPLHPPPPPTVAERAFNFVKGVLTFPFRVLGAIGAFIANSIGLLVGGAKGGTGEKFRHSPLDLDRDQALPGDQGEWSGEMRNVGVQGPMVKNVGDMFKLGDSKNAAFPLRIQKWQNAQDSTQLVKSPGYLAVISPETVLSSSASVTASVPGDAIVQPSGEATPQSKVRTTASGQQPIPDFPEEGE